MRFGWARLGFAVFLAAQVACSAILGTRDLTYDANADGGGSSGGPGDGSSGGPVDGSSGGPTDGGEGGACTDLMSDGKNCGTCGHDCLGGTCMMGKCQPVALKMGGNPRTIRLDATHLYWSDANGSRVSQMDKNGANVIDLVVGAAGGKNDFPFGLAVDGTTVYWGSADGFVLRCKIGGCANTPQVVATTTSFFDVAQANGKLFWIESTGPDKIFSAPVAQNGGPGALVASNTEWNRVAADATNLYVTSDDKTVHRVDPGTKVATIVSTGNLKAFAVAVDDTNVYWSDGDDPASIDFAPKTATNAAPTPIAATQHNPLAIAVDAAHLYWANAFVGLGGGTGSINMCAFTACAPVTLADNRRSPLSIAVDDQAIYWAEFDDGNGMGGIYKLAK
ncbi:MAG TPA: hypothetical protein VIF62_12095 [Labilithrix sp.]